MRSHIRLQGILTLLTKSLQYLMAVHILNLRALEKTIRMISYKNKTHHFTVFIIMRGEFMCCGPLLVIKTDLKHEVLISIHVSIHKAPNGTFDHRGENVHFHISSKQPCNPTSKIRLSQTEYKNTVIYTWVPYQTN